MLCGQTTVGGADAARDLARSAVELGLAACVQIEGPVESVYQWRGQVEVAPEWRLLFKFDERSRADLEAWILARHPYQVPEWVVWSAEASPTYGQWLRDVGPIKKG